MHPRRATTPRRQRRVIDVIATFAVIGVAGYLIASYILVMSGAQHVGGAIGLVLVILAYAIVVFRAPTAIRWCVFGGWTIVILIASEMGTADVGQHPSASAGIATAVIVLLPMLVTRLWKPKPADRIGKRSNA